MKSINSKKIEHMNQTFVNRNHVSTKLYHKFIVPTRIWKFSATGVCNKQISQVVCRSLPNDHHTRNQHYPHFLVTTQNPAPCYPHSSKLAGELIWYSQRPQNLFLILSQTKPHDKHRIIFISLAYDTVFGIDWHEVVNQILIPILLGWAAKASEIMRLIVSSVPVTGV